jgi:hypothetical protein
MSVVWPDLSVKPATGLPVEAEPTLRAARFRCSAWLNAIGLLLVSWILIAGLSFQPRPGTEVIAVVFPPLWNSQQVFSAVASSDAAIVRTTALTAVVVVRPSDHDGLTRLRQAGAWLAIDPQAIAACMSNITGKYRS